MKPNLLAALIFLGAFLITNHLKGQSVKFAVFDIDMMVQAMPGYPHIDTLVQKYESDSMTAEYNFTMNEYSRLDSTYKADSSAHMPGAILGILQTQRSQHAYTLIYWQQYAQQKSAAKREQLASPLYEKVIVAYKKVLTTNHYALILKPGTYEINVPNNIDNLFVKVAAELKVSLPPGLR
jgi:hypothetical protein